MDVSTIADDALLSEKRWTPLGASSSSTEFPVTTEPKSRDPDRIQQLEEEKDEINASLFALTTRFAQIQFRLHQINEAPAEDRDQLLRELNEFAHKGCVDQVDLQCSEENEEESNEDLMAKHEVIINELKSQLHDLESFAFQQGAGSVPQSVQLQKQQALLEQLTRKLNLQVDDHDIAHASVDDLKNKVDDAVAEIVNPAKMKEKIINHLQTQIQDLERFVEFMQIEQEEGHKSSGSVPNSKASEDSRKKEKIETLAQVRRMLTVLQMFSISQLGCGVSRFAEDSSNKPANTKAMINNLKKAVALVKSTALSQKRSAGDGETTSTYEDSDEYEEIDIETPVNDVLTQAVRKDLCGALSKILSNGLVYDAGGKSSALIAPISCILPRAMGSSRSSDGMHHWELFLEYYDMKNGARLAKNPSRMLSRAFNLEDLVATGDESRTRIAKQSLLEAIHLVINDHGPLKRGHEDMFKALVCLGLNAGRLSRWIRLVSRCSSLISDHYTEASYVACTGLEGVCTVLSKLDSIEFHLPVDVATRPFKNIRDAF